MFPPPPPSKNPSKSTITPNKANPQPAPSTTTNTARTYYNSTDADTFYSTIWGGSHINIGIYNARSPSINEASLRTIHRMAALASPITSSTRILDLGAGYGGAARYLARTYGCHVTCLNLSDVENARNRKANREAGLEGLVDVVEGSFEDVPFEDGVFDVVWSQDAFLHSGDRGSVVRENDRVLVKEGGKVVFTDPMAAEGVDSMNIGPILGRLKLESLGSERFYKEEFQKRGFVDVGFEDHSEQLTVHYATVLEELKSREVELKGKISDEYMRNMKIGLSHWTEGGRSGKLAWGILKFHR